MKATKKMVAALLSVTTNEILVNLITDILRVEEEESWREQVVQELLEGSRKFYEPKDIKVNIVEELLSKETNIKGKTIIDGSVSVLHVFNTKNVITVQYSIEGDNWIHQYSISISDYLNAEDNA